MYVHIYVPSFYTKIYNLAKSLTRDKKTAPRRETVSKMHEVIKGIRTIFANRKNI